MASPNPAEQPIASNSRRRTAVRRTLFALVYLVTAALLIAWGIKTQKRVMRQPGSIQVFGNDTELYVFFDVQTYEQSFGLLSAGHPRQLGREQYMKRFDGTAWHATQRIMSPDPYVFHPHMSCIFRHHGNFFIGRSTKPSFSFYCLDERRATLGQHTNPNSFAQELELDLKDRAIPTHEMLDELTIKSGWTVLYRDSHFLIIAGQSKIADPLRSADRFVWNGNEYVILGSVENNVVELRVEPVNHSQTPGTILIEFDSLGIPALLVR